MVIVALTVSACAPGGGILVSEDAAKLGGNLFVEQLADGGMVMVLDGEINEDTSFVFQRVLQDIGANGLVIAQSPGGSVLAAHEIGREIKARKMNTLVLTSCASACVDVFVAGKRREMTDVSELGLHAPSIRPRYSWLGWLSAFSVWDEEEALQETYEIDRAYWAEMGFPLINEKAYRVPNNRIWIVTPERARELRLATRILSPDN